MSNKIINTPYLLQGLTGISFSSNTSTSTFAPTEVIPQTGSPSSTPTGTTSTSNSTNGPLVYLAGDDPSLIINPQKVGSSSYRKSNIWESLKARGIKNGQLNQKDPTQLVFIGETNGASKLYINPTTNKAEYMLHPSAAKAWFRWREEMKLLNIPYRISSGYRSYAHQNGIGSGSTVAAAGSSPHGVGGAIDFGNLYRIVNGTGSPSLNAQGRRSKQYQDIAKAGANYYFFNPWRLADSRGTVDEIWHFEYWGPL